MNELKKSLIARARKEFGNIQTCPACPTLDESFTIMHGLLVFWFNTEDNSTHVLTEPLRK